MTWLMVLVTDDEDTRGCLDDIVGDGLELIKGFDTMMDIGMTGADGECTVITEQVPRSVHRDSKT